MFINEQWTAGTNSKIRTIYNPATNEPIAQVAEADLIDVEIALKAARSAFDEGEWPRTSSAKRAECLFNISQLLENNIDELSKLETLNNGKPLRESRIDVTDAAACFRYYAGLISKPLGQTYDVPDVNILSFTLREPVGVCGQIIPWNFPLLMAAWKLAPALAAGNVCILKPSELTPLTAIRLFELIHAAGIPLNAAQLVLGDGFEIGTAIAKSPLIDKIAFTGGTVTGRKIMALAANNLTKLTLELGGKSPNIIFDDVDIESAVEWALYAILCCQGEVCTAGSRLLLHESIFEKFVDKLLALIKRVKIGNGLDSETEMGPLISAAHMRKVLDYIQIGINEGASLLAGGNQLTHGNLAKGNFIEPTILHCYDNKSRVVQEEIFGPVLTVQTFKDEAEAIDLANDTQYGLAAGVFTMDTTRGLRVLKEIKAGITWVNCYLNCYNESPQGGYKKSGMGRELGVQGLEPYLETKQININLRPGPCGWFSRIN